MKATAISSIKRACFAVNKIGERTRGVEGSAEFSKTISKWPATMLAVKRTARVKGRIKFLTVSIRTIKGMSRAGVLCGIK
jgi:hypothetical protein